MKFRAADNAIYGAWVAGAMWGAIELFYCLLSLSVANDETLSVAILRLANVVVIFALTYGIYNKSRICAVLLFAFFLFWRIVYWQFSLGTLLLTTFVGYGLFQGMRGTFVYQRVRQVQAISTNE